MRAPYAIPTFNTNTPNPTCPICNLRVQTHAKKVYCTLCQSVIHINCLQLYSPTDLDYALNNSNWSCSNCLKSNFPFYSIDDNTEFISLTSSNPILDLPNFDNLIFNPYDFNEEEGGILTDIDPDANFYNTRHPTPMSQYLHIPDLNRKTQKLSKSFSILHLNIRSIAKNFK